MGRVVKTLKELDLSGLARVRRLAARRKRPEAVVRLEAGGQWGQSFTSPADPRWVLAVRTAEQLQGTILTPEHRQRLVRLGKVMGLTPFDANLVIAIVQDQARRGHSPWECPAAGEAQLAMIPLRRDNHTKSTQHTLSTLAAVGAFLAIEVVMLIWLVNR